MSIIIKNNITEISEHQSKEIPTYWSSPQQVSELKNNALKGAVWVTLTSAVAVPMTLYRNWLLGHFTYDGGIIGQYALVVMFTQMVVTFVIFGGTTVATNYLPKIKLNKDKSAFIVTYTTISLLLSSLFILIMYNWPFLLNIFLKNNISPKILIMFLITTPIIVVGQMANYSLIGLTEYRLSSVLEQINLFLLCIISTIAFILFRQSLISNALLFFLGLTTVASIIVIIVGGYHVIKRISGLTFQYYLPSGFWRYSSFVHLNTFLTFAYLSIDQLFVLSSLGVQELGAYFILSQISNMIRFVPDRIGQVMLASFSKLIATNNHEVLHISYIRLCRTILTFGTPLALFMIIFSYPLAGLFGEWYAKRHLYLILLTAIASIGSIGGVNSMLIMSKDRAGLFLSNSIILIALQFGVTILLIHDYGIYAVIAGKAIGTISAQVGLFSIIRSKLDNAGFSIPKEYWISISIVLGTAIVASLIKQIPLPISVISYTALVIIFFVVIRFHPSELQIIFRRIKIV